MTLKEISDAVALNCKESVEIIGLNTLVDSNEKELTFLENKKYLKDLENTKAAAVLVKKDFASQVPSGSIALICDEPYLTLAKISKLFAPNVVEIDGKDAQVGENCQIMANVSLGKDVVIGDNCTIMNGAVICDNVSIGSNCVIYPNVSVYRDCIIGDDCIIHAGTVIGSDGFGFAPDANGKYIKIYQNGNVSIGNDVEIGANCTIDRGAFKSTVIESGVRIDNLVHIAHNCKIGHGTILAGQVGLAGSTTIGHYVQMAGQSASAGHLEIAPFTTILGKAGVTKSITEPKKSWAGFPLFEHRQWLKLQGRVAKLLK